MLGQHVTRQCAIGLLCLLSLLSFGCATAIHYQANEKLVDELGVPQAQKRLNEILFRSINPQVVDVETTNDFLHYRYRQPIPGPFGAPVGFTMAENRVFFTNIGRVDAFENNLVMIRSASEIVLAQMVFANAEDARTFTELLLAFRERRVRR